MEALKPRGTAAMNEETRTRVASLGGLAVSQDKTHMGAIGSKGGKTVSQNRAYMSELGRRGAAARKAKKAIA